MAKKCSPVLRQHFFLLVKDMPIFSTAAIATIAENGGSDHPWIEYWSLAVTKDQLEYICLLHLSWQNFYKFLYVSTKELDLTYLALSTNNGNKGVMMGGSGA